MASLLDRLIGHTQTMQRLFEALERGQLASALLFAGPSGVGKRLAAQALAQTLVCERAAGVKPVRACGECGSCVRIEKGQSESLLVVEPEGVGIKAERARDILRFISLQKLGRARIVIIDQAHLLNPQAGNSLLKSIEEPPSGTYFILVTSMPAAVLQTIRSRSQLVRFGPLTAGELKRVLGPEADAWSLEAAQGSVELARRMEESRDDYLSLEQAVAGYLRAAGAGVPVEQISKLKDLMKDKPSQVYVSTLVQSIVRDALRVQAGLEPSAQRRAPELVMELSRHAAEGVRALADLALELEQDFLRNVDRSLALENFAIRWRETARPAPEVL